MAPSCEEIPLVIGIMRCLWVIVLMLCHTFLFLGLNRFFSSLLLFTWLSPLLFLLRIFNRHDMSLLGVHKRRRMFRSLPVPCLPSSPFVVLFPLVNLPHSFHFFFCLVASTAFSCIIFFEILLSFHLTFLHFPCPCSSGSSCKQYFSSLHFIPSHFARHLTTLFGTMDVLQNWHNNAWTVATVIFTDRWFSWMYKQARHVLESERQYW
jgi:hypothetical protein